MSNNGTSGLLVNSEDKISSAGTNTNLDDANYRFTDLNHIPLPLKLRPFVRRLKATMEDDEELTHEKLLAIIFLVRLGDGMMGASFATILTRSFVDELRRKLKVADLLELEIELSATRWSYQQGSISTYHRISSTYDGRAMQVLSRIALGVLHENLTVLEALDKIHELDLGVGEFEVGPFETGFRTLPTRMWVIPILSAPSAVVYFNGTWVDFLSCLVSGTLAGWIHYGFSDKNQLEGVQDIVVSIATAIMTSISMQLFPNAVCFTAQILGVLFWFLYGTSFMMSLYEVTENMIMTGVTRFFMATLNSFVLAFGVLIGLWISGHAHSDETDKYEECTKDLNYSVSPRWTALLFPMVALGALMQLRVTPRHWPVCLLTQLVAVQSQTLLQNQPLFVDNFVPAFLATLSGHVFIVLFQKLELSHHLAIGPKAYEVKQWLRKQIKKENLRPFKILFFDHGWENDRDNENRQSIANSGAGYLRESKFHYQRSDLWFSIIPALYLLVPGSSVWRIAFFSIVLSAQQGQATDDFSLQALISGVLVVGMGQVIGVKLALAVLWAWTNFLHLFDSAEERESRRQTNIPATETQRLVEGFS